MRDDYEAFQAVSAEILAIAPDSLEATKKYLAANPMPFPLLVDETHGVFDRYDVVKRLASLGQRPGLFVVGADGNVAWDQIGKQQWEIPGNEQVLGVLDRLS